ncbi:helix-turn-helix transcriptional regulator [Pseudoxanthomonas sp. NC8]|nr:helix-turn-helix transcriptional regulator [Pseudoxanthomonas sp. NC8]
MYSMPVRIRQCRTAAGLSQTQLATQVGVRRSAVAQWEQSKGGTSPSVGHLAQVAVATGACFEWLATGRGPTRPSGTEFESAATTLDFAKDELENRVLNSIRRLSYRNRLMACRIVELMAG